MVACIDEFLMRLFLALAFSQNAIQLSLAFAVSYLSVNASKVLFEFEINVHSITQEMVKAAY